MFTLPIDGAAAPTVSTAASSAPILPDAKSTYSSSREQIRHMLFSSPHAVQSTILILYQLGYAEPNDWSRPIITTRENEVMAVLTKRVTAM